MAPRTEGHLLSLHSRLLAQGSDHRREVDAAGRESCPVREAAFILRGRNFDAEFPRRCYRY
jgi:hypothetical protein